MAPTPSFIDRYACCPLCASPRLIPNFTYDIAHAQLTWDRCSDCTLVFQNPRLAEQSIRALYEATDYFGHKTSGTNAAYLNYVQNDSVRIAQGRKRMARIVAVTGKRSGQLLDVGSASGFFGVAAREAGFDVTCIEPDAILSRFGSKNYRLNFIQSTLEAAQIPENQYEMITLWGSDSHFLHPLHSFEKLSSALRPGGVLAMTYQNFDHWIRRVFPRLKVNWNVMFNHTNRSMDFLLQKLDFSLLHRGLEWQTVPVDHLFRILRLPFPEALRHGFVRIPAVSFPLIIARKRTAR